MSKDQPYSVSHSLESALKQTQRLIMSPQMQQAIHLLQVPVMELTALIELEMEQNPLLEYLHEEENREEVQEEERDIEPVEVEMTFHEHDFNTLRQLEEDFEDHWEQSGNAFGADSNEAEKRHTFIENSLCNEESLYEHLMHQARESFDTTEQLRLAEALIGSVGSTGFLQTPLEEIAAFCVCDQEALRPILDVIQTFDPPGVGACTLQEGLLIQLSRRNKESSLAYCIVKEHYEELLHNQIPAISKALSCSAEVIVDTIEKEIACLDLHPGLSYGSSPVQLLVPDVALRIEGDNILVAEINDEYIPPVRLNRKYLRLLKEGNLPKEAQEFIKQRVVSAKWLLRNILQRNETIVRIAGVLAERQRNFFLSPQGSLVPLTMRVIAEELELHESTIARAVAHKYIDTPRGLLPLRFFFTNAYINAEGEDISSNTVRASLQELLLKEDKKRPHSDQSLSELLSTQGIPCARRTVAKYRSELGFGNTQQRRKY